MKVLLIDAYDSFIYIVKNYIENIGINVDVIRNDKVELISLQDYQAIILGPGPGHPIESCYIDILGAAEGILPIFGVCLGMQAIAEYYGLSVNPAISRQHGKTSLIRNDMKGCFTNLPSEFLVTRYHSLVVDENLITSDTPLVITARSLNDNYVMGLRHKNYLIEGVQFHPESISTEYGMNIFENFFRNIVNQC
ncbi:anthranilate synthase component II [Gilliamella sp. Bif1-4]|uniref:anthranilate synthase component II n=1 Tax=Gilliamella sp. Bif1-4 TaxID=3120233 RepID=UPI00080DE92D|nr:aminodeoxychorismate/anthranilate synthase component II [Gilliamella apicola]OCG42674.1 hypothetical protein A9G25_01335 [Gilliamella apicola]